MERPNLSDSLGRPLHIAIDGYVATGKTTVGIALARRLGILFLDAGVLYRTITLIVREVRIDPQDGDACGVVAEVADVRLIPPTADDGRSATVLAGKRDVTWEIRSADVDHFVPQVAAHPRVREAVRWRQHQIAAHQPIVMVGRDITTVVLPMAQVKVMLTAPLEERVKRRYAEMRAQHSNVAIDFEALRVQVTKRDKDDSVRTVESNSTRVIDTANRSIDQVVEEIVQLAEVATDPSGKTFPLPSVRKRH